MRSHSRSSCLITACCTGLLIVATALPGIAEEPYTGFTRPGVPDQKFEKGGIRLAADDSPPDGKIMGATIYFKVLERTGDAADPWGSGVSKFVRRFEQGVDSKGVASPALDTSARYLYLYQVVNDRTHLLPGGAVGKTMPIESASVQLQVDARDITSWGYFDGVGFAVREEEKEARQDTTKIRPVAAGHDPAESVPDKIYQNDADAKRLKAGIMLSEVPTRRGEKQPQRNEGKIIQVFWDHLDPANNPNHVILLNEPGSNETNNSPRIRAIWSGENKLNRNGRSTVFGFTSNLPPTMDAVYVRSTKEASQGTEGIRLAATEANETMIREGILSAVGKVPTPTPPNGIAGAAPAPNTPFLGPTGSGGTPPAAGGFAAATPPGIAGGIGSAQPSRGGGGGIGGGSGGGQGNSNSGQNQNGNTTINFNATLTNQQAQGQLQGQGQFQGQGQGQGQNQGGGGGHVIPEPASWLSAAFALMGLMWYLRRRLPLLRPALQQSLNKA